MKTLAVLFTAEIEDRPDNFDDLLLLEAFLNMEIAPLTWEKYGIATRFHITERIA